MSYLYAIPDYCLKILKILTDSGFEAYAVGGAVRDILMKRPPHDFDIATSALPDEIITVMTKSGIRTVDMAKKHGTVTAVIDGNNVEITTYRVDGEYADNRHPQNVEFTKNIALDVSRRDFTMNALYLASDGSIVDLNGGTEDIKAKQIRAVGDAETRFDEDALRIMRGLRFAAELGFNIEAETEKAMYTKKQLLNNISGERLCTEFTKLVIAPYASRVIREYTEVFAVFCSSLLEARGFKQNSSYHDKDVLEHILAVLDYIPLVDGHRDVTLAYAALFHDLGKPYVYKTDENGVGHMKGHAEVSVRIWEETAERFKTETKLRTDVSELIKYHDSFPEPEQKSVHRFMMKHSEDNLIKLHILQKADLSAHTAKASERVKRLAAIMNLEQDIRKNNLVLSRKDLAINGKNLMDIGINPGPQMGDIIDALLEAVINGEAENNSASLISYVLMHQIDS